MSSSRISVSPLALLLLVATIIGGIAFVVSMQHQPPTTQEILAKQKIAIIGDSLTEQGGNGVANLEAILAKAGFKAQNVYIYGVDGKRIVAPDKYEVTTLQNIEQARAKLHKVNVWLIALGTNDRGSSAEQVKQDVALVLKKIGNDKVLWVNTSSRDSSYEGGKRANVAIKEALAKDSNATYLDWDSYIHKIATKTDWIASSNGKDPIHMTDAGYKLRNGFYLYRIAAAADKTVIK